MANKRVSSYGKHLLIGVVFDVILRTHCFVTYGPLVISKDKVGVQNKYFTLRRITTSRLENRNTMKDKKGWQKVNNCRSGSRSKYDKEMDNAFTLIFHNIKRLQDGHLSNSHPCSDTTGRQGEMNPPSTLQVPMQRPRASSVPLNRLTEGGIFCQTKEASDTRPKSHSVTDKVSPSLQRRKVTFADDYTAKEQCRRASDFIKRPSSDLQTRRSASDFIKRPSSDLQPRIYCF